MKIRVARRAVAEGDRAARWWRQNRSASPTLFEDELDAALDLLRVAPEAGSPVARRVGRPLRRALKPRTGYHLYYRFEPGDDHVLVLSVWSASRGRSPRLPS